MEGYQLEALHGRPVFCLQLFYDHEHAEGLVLKGDERWRGLTAAHSGTYARLGTFQEMPIELFNKVEEVLALV